MVCTATVETVGPTGVEMEALTAVQVALLTIYDMCKAVDRAMAITDVRVLEKHGGKSGSFMAEAAPCALSRAAWAAETLPGSCSRKYSCASSLRPSSCGALYHFLHHPGLGRKVQQLVRHGIEIGGVFRVSPCHRELCKLDLPGKQPGAWTFSKVSAYGSPAHGWSGAM